MYIAGSINPHSKCENSDRNRSKAKLDTFHQYWKILLAKI